MTRLARGTRDSRAAQRPSSARRAQRSAASQSRTHAAQRPSSARRSEVREGGSAASQSRTGLGTRKNPGAIGIVGLGLIGGSLAKAVAARHPKRILIGVEPSARTRRLASKDQIFDRLLARPSTELAACEIVVLCAPVPAILRLLGPVSRRMRRGALLSDVGGVKEPIAAAARKSVAPGIRFVGAHPMFGGGIGGYKAGRKDLWRGGAVAVCTDGRDPDAVSAAARFYRALGARVILTSAREHDAAVAVVSHLPYVIGSALALTARAAGPLALRLAGRGLVDVTRLAEFAFPIQGAAVRGNSHLSQASRRFQRTLRSLLRALSQEGSRGEDSFRRARKARMAFMEARAAALAGTRP